MPHFVPFARALTMVLLAAATASSQPARPRVLDVPASFGTIQLAIDSARRGDTVLVQPGRYYENIRFKGKGIVVTSRFGRTRDLGDIERTIIDGSRPRHPDSASVVMLVNQEDTTAVLQGFTITGGKGTVWLDAKDQLFFREGGGILCELSSPTIRFNYIVDNEATEVRKGVLSAGGGAIRCGYAEPTITNNVIRGNRGRYGAGIVLFHSAATVRNNLIVENVGGEDFGGAGLWAVGALSYRLANVVEHNTIANNRSVSDSSASPRQNRGTTGGVATTWVKLEFRNNIVWGNSQVSGGQFGFQQREQLTLAGNVVQGGIQDAPAGHGTIEADPRFADPRRFELAAGSPARGGKSKLEAGVYGGPLAARLIP